MSQLINSVPARLLPLPMTRTSTGDMIPDLKVCVEELLKVVGEAISEDKCEEVAGLLLDYLIKHHKSETIAKLCEKRMIPKVIDEFDCAALLDESNVKIWH